MPVITARLSIDSDSIIDAGFMRLASHFMSYYYNRFLRIFRIVGALGSAAAAGMMAFFTGLVVPTRLWEMFADHRQDAPSADVPVVVFGMILGAMLAVLTIVITARWLWPKKLTEEEKIG
jgi:hypothetical protein